MSYPELDQSVPLTFEQRMQAMSESGIYAQLIEDNSELADLGVRTPVNQMVFGASRYGHLYEDKIFPAGGTRPTPMNCLVALLHREPRLQELPPEDFKRLAGTVSRISIATETLMVKTGKITYPEALKNHPRRPSRPT